MAILSAAAASAAAAEKVVSSSAPARMKEKYTRCSAQEVAPVKRRDYVLQEVMGPPLLLFTGIQVAFPLKSHQQQGFAPCDEVPFISGMLILVLLYSSVEMFRAKAAIKSDARL